MERMTRFELATLTLAKKRLWSPSVQSVYCCAVPHSPQIVREIRLVRPVRIPVYHRPFGVARREPIQHPTKG